MSRSTTKDSDCTVNPSTNVCDVCGAEHGAPCVHCNQRAFHDPRCLCMLAAPSPGGRVLKLQRDTAVKFVGVGCSVMRGGQNVATAISHTFARRIARALNEHEPNSRGV
jgi:hypothetical protein